MTGIMLPADEYDRVAHVIDDVVRLFQREPSLLELSDSELLARLEELLGTPSTGPVSAPQERGGYEARRQRRQRERELARYRALPREGREAVAQLPGAGEWLASLVTKGDDDMRVERVLKSALAPGYDDVVEKGLSRTAEAVAHAACQARERELPREWTLAQKQRHLREHDAEYVLANFFRCDSRVATLPVDKAVERVATDAIGERLASRVTRGY